MLPVHLLRRMEPAPEWSSVGATAPVRLRRGRGFPMRVGRVVFDRRRRRIGRCAVETGNVVFLDRMCICGSGPGSPGWNGASPFPLRCRLRRPPRRPRRRGDGPRETRLHQMKRRQGGVAVGQVPVPRASPRRDLRGQSCARRTCTCVDGRAPSRGPTPRPRPPRPRRRLRFRPPSRSPSGCGSTSASLLLPTPTSGSSDCSSASISSSTSSTGEINCGCWAANSVPLQACGPARLGRSRRTVGRSLPGRPTP